jgi:glycosyltransferase involved in cell wall biosynthesis
VRILWVVPKWTFPINDGARIATDRLLRAMKKAGAQIDVVAICPTDEITDEAQMRSHWSVSKITILRRTMPKTQVGKIFFYACKLLTGGELPLTFSSFQTRKLQAELRGVLQQGHYDLVLLDGLHTAVPFRHDLTRGSGPRFLLRAHNVETELWEKASEQPTFSLKRWFLRSQAEKVRQFEGEVLRAVAGVAAIAKEDLQKFAQLTTRPLAYIPLGLDFTAPLSHSEVDPNKFLFVGRLDWPPNRDGLRWLLDNVWSKVVALRPAARLSIAGVGDARWLESYRQLPGVQFLGVVTDIKDAYRSAAFSIAPLFYGSGTRIKIVEAFAMDRSLISTAMGVQGAEVESDMYTQAESVDDWVRVLSQITYGDESRTQLAQARERMKQKFDETQVGQLAYDWCKTFL